MDNFKPKNYTKGVDFKFLKAMGVRVVEYQPWQFGLFIEELEGKFVWYPRKGTLMFDHREKGINTKIGHSGLYRGDEDTTEEVYNVIIQKVKQQQDENSI